jgi:hypothetical protein
MAEIDLDRDEFIAEMVQLRDAAEELELPILRTSTDCTIAGLQYIPAMYNDFKTIVSKYIILFKRDLGLVADTACAICLFDNACANVFVLDDVHSVEDRWSRLIECMDPPETVEYTVGPAAHLFSDWLFRIYDLDTITANVIENLTILMEKSRSLKGAIEQFQTTSHWRGNAATTALGYFHSIHADVCDGLRTTAENIICHVSSYLRSYIEEFLLYRNGPDYQFHKGTLNRFLTALDDSGNCLRSKHTYIVSETMNLFMNTNYAFDFTEIMPNLRVVSDHYNDMDEVGRNTLSAIDDNEDNLMTNIQSELESPILLLVDMINSIIANVQGRYDYIYPPTTDVIGLNDYEQTFTDVREYNEENHLEDMCVGLTHAGEVNTAFAADIRDMNNQQDLIVGLFAVVCGAYGLTVIASTEVGGYFIAAFAGSGIQYIFTVSECVENLTEFYDIHWGGNQTGGFNPLLEYGFAGDTDAYADAKEWASYGSIISQAATFSPTATMNELEYLVLLLLRKWGSAGVVDVLVGLGLNRDTASLLVSRVTSLCNGAFSSYVSDQSAMDFISSTTAASLTQTGTANQVANAIESNLAVTTYTESYLDSDGYDESRLEEMGLIGA